MEVDAIAFDAFGTLFDLDALREPMGDEIFEGFAARFVPWTWHATAAGSFSPLPEIAASALAASARAAGVQLEEGYDERLSAALRSLPAFPDVAAGLDALAGRRLAILSNGTGQGLAALVECAGLGGRFEYVIAADHAERYKPSRDLYALAPQRFRTRADRVLMVSANEWDVAGAAQFGLRTAWLGRGRTPSWVLGVRPDLIVDHLPSLATLLDAPPRVPA